VVVEFVTVFEIGNESTAYGCGNIKGNEPDDI
jgi:hypothetical protein